MIYVLVFTHILCTVAGAYYASRNKVSVQPLSDIAKSGIDKIKDKIQHDPSE